MKFKNKQNQFLLCGQKLYKNWICYLNQIIKNKYFFTLKN
ncbi:hypothetical protein pb186bvf_001361 [Paramecium bursaria]